jgi:HAD superfamily hydrolase (TIGR01490 family)
MMKLRLYPNWKCKQRVFSFFFKGMDAKVFRQLCEQFSERIEGFKRTSVLEIFQQHVSDGAEVYVVSASVDEWIAPFCRKYGIDNVIGTKIEIDSNGALTGRFSTRNCYGQEKVCRFMEAEPDRRAYTLYAYGDSRGDRDIIELADKGFWV